MMTKRNAALGHARLRASMKFAAGAIVLVVFCISGPFFVIQKHKSKLSFQERSLPIDLPSLLPTSLLPALPPPPQRVLLVPTDPKEQKGASKHIFVDGIRRSSRLEHAGTEINDTQAHWFIDAIRCNPDCLKTMLMSSNRQQLLSKEKGNETLFQNTIGNSTYTSQLFIADYTDSGYNDGQLKQFFQLAKDYFGKGNFVYITRTHMLGRRMDILEHNHSDSEPFDDHLGEPRVFPDIFFSHFGVRSPIQVGRYGVRTDLVDAVAGVLEKKNLSSTADIAVTIHRPKDAVHFWDPNDIGAKHGTPGGVPSNLRAAVSRAILSLPEDKRVLASEINTGRNYSFSAGIFGARSRQGRSEVHEAYVQELLANKIVVVAQRDEWECHYRLMEALVSGAMVMTDPMHPLPHLLKDGESVVVYNSIQELKGKILYYIEHDRERLDIAREGYSIAMNHHRSWNVMERWIFET